MAEQRTLDAERAAPCPFCGGDLNAHDDYYIHPYGGCFFSEWEFDALNIEKWNRRAPPALDAEGLPELPEPVDTLAAEDGFNVIGEQGVYTAEQVRQVQRDARVDAEREIGLLKMVCEQLKARLASADALIESMATKADRAQIARTSAPVGAPVGMVLVPVEPTDEMVVAFAETWFNKVRPIDDCGMEDCYAAMLAAAPTSASAQPADQNKMENNDE